MAPAPVVVGEILAIPVDQIEIGERLRAIDPVWAQALGGVIKAEGQNTPIEVCRLPGSAKYRLVSGGHRLTGARLTGQPTINAVVVDNGALERRVREVSENLWRKGLDPADRAAFVAELYTLQKARSGLAADEDGRKVSAQVRWQKALKAQADHASATVALAYGWADGVADQLGLSRRSIYNDLALHRGLLPDTIGRLRGHRVVTNAGQLHALARMSPADQREAVSLILAGGARSVSDALAVLAQKPKPTPEAKAWSAFFGGWSRMSAAMRRDALRELEKLGLPKGARIVFDKGE